MLCDCCGQDDWHPLFRDNGFTLRRCERCGLAAIFPMPSHETRMTELEDGHFGGGQRVLDARRQRTSERIQAARFQSYVDVARAYSPEGRWLDIGCGAGGLLALARTAGYEVEGIELTRDRREEAQRVSGSRIHAAPVEDIGFAGNTFDVVSLIDVFSHLTSPGRTLSELARILRPGGIVLCVTGELGRGVQRRHMFSWNLGDHLYFLGQGTMASYATKTNLSLIAREVTWLPSTLYTRERFLVRGCSNRRNMLKYLIARTPLALPLLRKIMLHREAGNDIHAGCYVLAAPSRDILP